jgi:hypothetical protein
MEEFTQEEQLAMPELNEGVRTDLMRFQNLAETFVFAQKELESDEFGTGSLFNQPRPDTGTSIERLTRMRTRSA